MTRNPKFEAEINEKIWKNAHFVSHDLAASRETAIFLNTTINAKDDDE